MTAQAVAPEAQIILTSKGVEVRQPDGHEGSRWYVDPETGDLLASVTTCISSCTSKPWLVAWGAKLAAETAVDEHVQIDALLAPRPSDAELTDAQRIEVGRERRRGAVDYLKGAAARKREAASERGTWVHDVVEALVLDQPVPDVPEDVKPYLDRFIDWWCDFTPRPFMSEATVADRTAGWAGTLDLGVYFPTLGHSAVIDVKTGANLDVWMRVQLSAYRRAKVVFLPLGRVAAMPKTERAYVLHLMPDAYKMIDVTERDDEYALFLAMLRQTRWNDQQQKRLGMVVYPPLPDGSQPSPLIEDVDGIPAANKLIEAGVERVDDLFHFTARELLMLPGVGPAAIRALPDVCAQWSQTIEGLAELIAELDAKDAEKRERALRLTQQRAAAHAAGKHAAKPIKGCADCAAVTGECVCVFSCADDPATACSLSGVPHVHPLDAAGLFGPCAVHPDAPGDL